MGGVRNVSLAFCAIVLAWHAGGCSSNEKTSSNGDPSSPLGTAGSIAGTSGTSGATVVGPSSGSGGVTAVNPTGGRSASAGVTSIGTGGVLASVAGKPASAGSSSAGATAAAGASAPPDPNLMRPVMPSAGCGMANPPASGNMSMDVDGTMRDYIVAVPTGYDATKPYRLIFAWHGLGGTAMQIASGFGGSGYYGLQSRAMNTAIFIAGQGLSTSTGSGGAGGASAASSAGWPNTGDRDIAFVRKLVDWATNNYCVDKSRIFSVGMSYGGIMSNTIGCEMGDVFRAITPMSGSGPRQGFGAKPCVGQVAAWMSHGNMDTTVPFAQGQMSRDHWVMNNHCTMDTMPVGPGNCVAYQGCDPAYPVTWCEFDGGHTIPTYASDAIWKFLSQF